jgi:hypothetical protein
MEEGALGRDERLLVQGTPTRAPPKAAIRISPTFQYSHIPTFQFEIIDQTTAEYLMVT